MFEHHSKDFLPQLAMLQTLADYVKMNMPELVETQAKHTKLTWKKIEDNGYNENHFKIHMKAVYDLFVSKSMNTTRDSDDDDN